jgi:hypothetical protein
MDAVIGKFTSPRIQLLLRQSEKLEPSGLDLPSLDDGKKCRFPFRCPALPIDKIQGHDGLTRCSRARVLQEGLGGRDIASGQRQIFVNSMELQTADQPAIGGIPRFYPRGIGSRRSKIRRM